MNRQIVSIYIKENYPEKAPSAKKLQKEQPRIFDAIYDYTSEMPKGATITERCYFMKAGLIERPVCDCGKLLKFKSYKTGYPTKCSKTCKG